MQGIRAKILAIVGLLSVGLVLMGLVGIYQLNHLAREGNEAMVKLKTAIALVDTARSAQHHFKIQVQEWKNILIRGGDAAAFDKYRKAFDDEERKVQERLGAIKDIAAKKGLLPQSTCEANELCAPCFSPTDGSDTGACSSVSCDAPKEKSPLRRTFFFGWVLRQRAARCDGNESLWRRGRGWGRIYTHAVLQDRRSGRCGCQREQHDWCRWYRRRSGHGGQHGWQCGIGGWKRDRCHKRQNQRVRHWRHGGEWRHGYGSKWRHRR